MYLSIDCLAGFSRSGVLALYRWLLERPDSGNGEPLHQNIIDRTKFGSVTSYAAYIRCTLYLGLDEVGAS